MARGDRDDRIVHRLESFSDVVIGFSLAELGINLVLPTHAVEFFSRPAGLGGFIFTFAIISALWWNHATLFRHFFVPTRLTVLVNFAMLGCAVLLAFSLQMWLHFATSTKDDVVAAYTYFAVFAATYLMLGYMFLVGVTARWAHLAAEERRIGVRRTSLTLGLSLGLIVGLTCASFGVFGSQTVDFSLGSRQPAIVPSAIIYGLFAGMVASGVVRRLAFWRLGLLKSDAAEVAE